MGNILADLSVAGKLALKALGRRLRSEVSAPPDAAQFALDMEQLLARAPAGIVSQYRWVDLAADQPPWVPTGVELAAGEEVSYFACGRAYANRLFDIYVSPALNLWCKVGAQGEIFRGTRNSHSFRAAYAGELLLGNYFPNDWVDTQGARKQPDTVYSAISGGYKVLVVVWSGEAQAGLRKLLETGDVQGRVGDELARIEQGDTTPPGWHYLWHIGPAEIYRHHAAEGRSDCIYCRTHADVGILQKAVDLPLLPSSEISWRWCVSQLPSTLREDSVPSHDYLSIAVEFDNGRDITYYWSSNLPVGTGYDCPLPNWSGKEFHVVIRSGREGLGQWHGERRNLYEDYLHYMGEPPARIVKVWLIANSIFQRGEGICDYADITLTTAEQRVELL
jgi:hypothetical protein